MTGNERQGQELKLLALDADDLAVISTHMQDAVLTVSEMAYLARDKRFALVANRFDWETAEGGQTQSRRLSRPHFRRRTGLRFERVLGAKLTGIDLKDAKQALSILAIRFTPTDAPGGHITIDCSGGAAVRLHIECIEGELKDLGAAWRARSKPKHPDDSKTDPT